jgi:DNA-binding protein H-NS
METYRKLLEMREKIDEELKSRAHEREAIISEIQRKLLDYDIRLDELSAPRKKAVRGPVPVKYRDPKTGREWSGRGKPPLWIRDAMDREKYLVR